MASSKIRTIVIGTTNESKYQWYEELLSFLTKYSFELKKLPKKDNDFLSISETLGNLEANAVRKATTYAKHTGCFTIADDTGFFIPALNNEPGIAVRRWGGQLPENISDKEWEKFFLGRVKQNKIKEPNCLRRKIIVCSDPDGHYEMIEQQLIGKIKIPGAGHYVSGAPLSSYFFIEQCQRFEADLTKDDNDILLGELKIRLFDMILQSGYFGNLKQA